MNSHNKPTVAKPYAESADQNKEPILAVLRHEFRKPGLVLEIGSGTGQHAVFFSRYLPHLTWQPTELTSNLGGIELWLAEEGADNVLNPKSLDVCAAWPEQSFDFIFSANTVHIMGWPAVVSMIKGIGTVLKPGGRFCLYGPFNYQGRFTSDSNARFDQWLKSRDPVSGIRDFESMNELAAEVGMMLLKDYEMPVNNRILCWQKAS